MSDRWAVHDGDCREVMQAMEPESIDSIVSDPPYGLSFMGKGWDHGVPGVEFWEAALRVAKPGCHLLAFGGTRTFHRLTVAIEDAGWDIRDCLMWVYGSGFPKSLDVSKAIDKAAGAERETKRVRYSPQQLNCKDGQNERPWMKAAAEAGFHELPGDEPATDAARQWSGWGTALKPAWEPIILARKPLSGTVAANVLEHGTGAINVDGCRVGTDEALQGSTVRNDIRGGAFATGHKPNPGDIPAFQQNPEGRWPANLIHDGSDEVVGLFPQAGGGFGRNGDGSNTVRRQMKFGMKATGDVVGYGDSGSAARFFYCAKASKRDRDEGCEGLALQDCGTMEDDNYDIKTGSGNSRNTKRRNHHPTVKPTDLMRYLCRLITPPDGLVFDPFTGSGSTGKAAMLEGFRFVGAELSPEYIEIARARIGHAAGKTRQKELALA